MRNKSQGISPAAVGALARGDFANFLAASTPGGIEAQEKRGQLEQANLQTLPIYGTIKNRISCREGPGPKEAFEKLGFRFGKEIDDCFIECQFPAGWRKEPTDHSMWSHLIDDKGRKRGSIFYKAAFYDRSAHIDLDWRFRVTRDWDAKPKTRVYVEDACGQVKQEITGLSVPDYNGPRDKADAANRAIDDATAKLEAWLTKNFPQWQSAEAYWSHP
jgi:hypothetical protein